MKTATHLLKVKPIITLDIDGLGPPFSGPLLDLKQGCNLSPLLANIYLSDLHEHLEKDHKYASTSHEKPITSITWADDLLITSLQHGGLQKCIHKPNTYTQKQGLEVSLKKTRCVIFSKGHTKYDPQQHNYRK